MKKENFFTALRYITMVQNGDTNLTKGEKKFVFKINEFDSNYRCCSL